jgi:hypothetical protein
LFGISAHGRLGPVSYRSFDYIEQRRLPNVPSNRTIIAIKVHFTLNTPDGKTRVIFGLEKDTQGNTIVWKINFQLFERAKKSDAFGDAIIDLDVEVDSVLNANAEKLAGQKAMTAGQSAHALGPAAADAKAADDGGIEQAEADQTIQNTLKKK